MPPKKTSVRQSPRKGSTHATPTPMSEFPETEANAVVLKRKQAPASDDSDDEAVVTPKKPLAKKSKKSSALPAPQTPAFDALPPVSFAQKPGMKALATLKESLLDDSSDDDSAPVIGPQGRIRKPSQKAVYMTSVTASAKEEPDDLTLDSAKSRKKLSLNEILDAHKESLLGNDNKRQDLPSPKQAPVKPTARAGSSKKRVEVIELTTSAGESDHSPSPVRPSAFKGKGKSPVKKEFGTADSDDDLSAAVQTAKSQKDDSNPFIDNIANEHLDDKIRSENDIEDAVQNYAHDDLVMREELQDPRLKPFYVDLPKLTYCEVLPFSAGAAAGDNNMLLYSPMVERLTSKKDRIRLRRAVNFVSHGIYVNPARIASTTLGYATNRRVVMADTRQMAVFITTGAVSTCQLVHSASGVSNQISHRVRNISIFPFTQEYERSVSCIGSVYGQAFFYGHVGGGAMTFSTLKEGSAFSSAPSTPKKISGIFGTARPPSRAVIAPWSAPLKFEDGVPIYDGRTEPTNGHGFEYSHADFDMIKTLPLYRGGVHDLPSWALVSVGYSISTFAYTSNSAPSGSVALSANVLFVILLAIPDID